MSGTGCVCLILLFSVDVVRVMAGMGGRAGMVCLAWTGWGGNDSAVSIVRMERMAGSCKRKEKVFSISFRVTRKRIFNFLKPGNTKGAAAVHRLVKFSGPRRKRLCVGNGSY